MKSVFLWYLLYGLQLLRSSWDSLSSLLVPDINIGLHKYNEKPFQREGLNIYFIILHSKKDVNSKGLVTGTHPQTHSQIS